ncbi:MAG: hypothetical protein OEM03_11745 [Chromatiales bacterium]|nr:hypothetical protein [Chromatiales bacterium]
MTENDGLLLDPSPFGMIKPPAVQFPCGIRLFLLVLLATMCGACDAPARSGPGGYLYFGSGNYLGKFSLQDGSSQIVAYLGDLSAIAVGPYSDGDLLLTVRRVVNRQDTRMIGRFDVAQNHYKTLFVGDSAVYLPDREITVYDDGFAIQTSRIEDRERKITTVYSHGHHERVTLVTISDREILFQVGGEGGNRVFHYDAATEILTQLDGFSAECDLEGALWIAEQEQVLCHRPGDPRANREYRFVSSDGVVGDGLDWPTENVFLPVAYLPEKRLLVLTELWQGRWSTKARYGVWIYQLDSGESYRLAKDQYLGKHVVFKTL